MTKSKVWPRAFAVGSLLIFLACMMGTTTAAPEFCWSCPSQAIDDSVDVVKTIVAAIPTPNPICKEDDSWGCYDNRGANGALRVCCGHCSIEWDLEDNSEQAWCRAGPA